MSYTKSDQKEIFAFCTFADASSSAPVLPSAPPIFSNAPPSAPDAPKWEVQWKKIIAIVLIAVIGVGVWLNFKLNPSASPSTPRLEPEEGTQEENPKPSVDNPPLLSAVDPSFIPSFRPTFNPSGRPTPAEPSFIPSLRPTFNPSGRPTGISAQGNVCYFDCEYLTLDHNGTQLGQVGNCGYDCTSGIAADIKGVVHPELYLWETGYIENHGQYSYDTGPLNVQGINKNMFNRCYNECYNLPFDLTQLEELEADVYIVFPPYYEASSADEVWRVRGDLWDDTAMENAGKMDLYKNGVIVRSFYGEAAWDNYGASVAMSLDGMALAVGVSGKNDAVGLVEVHYRPTIADFFDQLPRLWGVGERRDGFGSKLAMTGNGMVLAVAAPNNDDDFNNAGTIYLFARPRISEPFEEVYRISGQCVQEQLGVWGLTFVESNDALTMHAKGWNDDGNGCINNDQRIRTFQVVR